MVQLGLFLSAARHTAEHHSCFKIEVGVVFYESSGFQMAVAEMNLP